MKNKDWKWGENALDLITEYKEDSWLWFLEPLSKANASVNMSSSKVYISKWKKEGYLMGYRGKSKKIPAKRKIIVKLIPSTPPKDKKNTKITKGPLNKSEAKILKKIGKGIVKKDLFKSIDLTKNKVTMALNSLIERKLVEEKKEKGEQSFQEKFVMHYIFNLKPFFDFCDSVNKDLSEKDKVIFSSDERKILRLLFGAENSFIRNKVYSEYNHTHFLYAILKFYIKHFFLIYEKPRKKIETDLQTDNDSIKWILSLNEEDLEKEYHQLYLDNPTKNTKKYVDDLYKIRNWHIRIAEIWKLKNSTDIDEDDFNYYGGIYQTFYNYNKKLIKNLGWKLIQIFTLMNQ